MDEDTPFPHWMTITIKSEKTLTQCLSHWVLKYFYLTIERVVLILVFYLFLNLGIPGLERQLLGLRTDTQSWPSSSHLPLPHMHPHKHEITRAHTHTHLLTCIVTISISFSKMIFLKVLLELSDAPLWLWKVKSSLPERKPHRRSAIRPCLLLQASLNPSLYEGIPNEHKQLSGARLLLKSIMPLGWASPGCVCSALCT